MFQVAVVIPAFNPLPSLISYVKSLSNLDVAFVLIINDGSEERYHSLFLEISNQARCIVIAHDRNKGKGRTLKTGFNYILKELSEIRSVLTVGVHGQHEIQDVQKVLHQAQVFSDGIILGVRSALGKEVPLNYMVGNRISSILFSLLFYKRLIDIQSGLRCIPRQSLTWLLKVPGESFNYDVNMLIEVIRRKISIYEIPIGQYKIKKNALIFYDEIIHPQLVIRLIVDTYRKFHSLEIENKK